METSEPGAFNEDVIQFRRHRIGRLGTLSFLGCPITLFFDVAGVRDLGQNAVRTSDGAET
jgi:hypothetical protein